MNIVDAWGDPHGGDERARGLLACLVEQFTEGLADQLFRVARQQRGRRRIGFDHALVAGVDDQDGLGGELEQQTIALLGVTDTGIFALHRLLRFGEALLQRRHRPEVAADRDEPAVGSEADGAVADGNIGPLARGIVDLAPARGRGRAGVADQFLDLHAAFRCDRIDPALADPVAMRLLAQFGAAEGDIQDDARGVHDKGDIGAAGDQRASHLRVDGPEALDGRSKTAESRRGAQRIVHNCLSGKPTIMLDRPTVRICLHLNTSAYQSPRQMNSARRIDGGRVGAEAGGEAGIVDKGGAAHQDQDFRVARTGATETDGRAEGLDMPVGAEREAHHVVPVAT